MVKFQGGTSPVHQPVVVMRLAGRNDATKRPKVGIDHNRAITTTMVVTTGPADPGFNVAFTRPRAAGRTTCVARGTFWSDKGISDKLIVFSPLLAISEH